MKPTAAVPITQEIVLVGGGHSHALVLQMWAMAPLPGVRLTLVSDRTHTPYSGMLPGHVAGVYDYDECHIDLRRLCEATGAQFFLDHVTGIEPERQHIICAEHPNLAFDWLSLDIGSTPAAVGVPGAADYAIPAKPVPEFLMAWESLVEALMAQSTPQAAFSSGRRLPDVSLGIVGGGAGGVELAISMRSRLQGLLSSTSSAPKTPPLPPIIHLFQRGPELLPTHSRANRRKFHQILSDQGIQVHLNATVEAIEPFRASAIEPLEHDGGDNAVMVRHSQGQTRCDRLFWVTNASAPAWIGNAGLTTDAQGFVLVSDTLQSVSHPHILAAGDIATMVNHRRPKAGVFAVRQGRPLFENLRALAQGRSPQPFRPQQELLGLIGTGDGRAVASRGRWSAGPSKWLWHWKDAIDRKFMRRFSELPVMASLTSESRTKPARDLRSSSVQANAVEPPPMYCSGCGAKVGKTVLDAALNRIHQDFTTPPSAAQTAQQSNVLAEEQAAVVLGLDAPDDAAVLQVPSDRLLIQTLDYFQSLVSDPFIFGQITANHCLNDIFAMGAMPHSVLALVQVPRGSDAVVEATLYQLLSGAMTVLCETETPLVGGHTTEGDALAFGLSCNGLGVPGQLWRKGGMQPGDRLILTKPLGTGTLFAAQMRGQAKGRWIDGAIASMVQSQAIAVDILRRHHVTACTDVTGFGLLGHLGEMVQASGHSICLHLAALPWLEGAHVTLEQGIVSSMHQQNARAARWVANWPSHLHPLSAILFDPQTSGGLLATLPEAEAEDCLAALQAVGFGRCQIVGEVVADAAAGAEGAAIALEGDWLRYFP